MSCAETLKYFQRGKKMRTLQLHLEVLRHSRWEILRVQLFSYVCVFNSSAKTYHETMREVSQLSNSSSVI